MDELLEYTERRTRAELAALPHGVYEAEGSVDTDGYTAPVDLPPGPVLVVGSGQSGCQIAEELREAGREVFLACGRAPWSTRRIGDRDLIWWAHETGFLDPVFEQIALGQSPGQVTVDRWEGEWHRSVDRLIESARY